VNQHSTYCCDANVALRLFDLESPEQPVVEALWERWSVERATILAPSLLRYEATNSVHRAVGRKEITQFRADEILSSINLLPIRYLEDDALHLDALRIAQLLNMPAAYDAHYLAVAQREQVDLYTLDKKLVNLVGNRLTYVRHVLDQ
jgi:predicted nucleic acid-binding protein